MEGYLTVKNWGAITVEDGFGFMELVFLKELEKQVLN